MGIMLKHCLHRYNLLPTRAAFLLHVQRVAEKRQRKSDLSEDDEFFNEVERKLELLVKDIKLQIYFSLNLKCLLPDKSSV
jgi:hypothetical protein